MTGQRVKDCKPRAGRWTKIRELKSVVNNSSLKEWPWLKMAPTGCKKIKVLEQR